MRSRFLALVISSIVSMAFLLVISGIATFPIRLGKPSTHKDPMPPFDKTDVTVKIRPTTFQEQEPDLMPHQATRLPRLVEVSERQFDRLVNDGLVLVKFGADWCGPCRRIVPELEQLAVDNVANLTVLSVDVDKERRLAKELDVGPIPRMLLFRDGEQIDQWTGYKSADRMQRQINQAVAAEPKGEIQSNPFAN